MNASEYGSAIKIFLLLMRQGTQRHQFLKIGATMADVLPYKDAVSFLMKSLI